MSREWDLVPLDRLISLQRRPVEVLPDSKYAEIGVYCFGRGIFHKTPRTGLEVGDKQLYEIREGDFILQVTFAWEGAVALASKKENGMFGSTRFLTFHVDNTKCHAPYLVNYFKTKEGLNQLVKISPGSAGRNRVLSIKRISEVVIPLPPIDEQQRIVAKVEAIAAKIEEARGLRVSAIKECNCLMSGKEIQLWDANSLKNSLPLQEVTTHLARGRQSKQGESNHYLIKTQHVQMGQYVKTKMTLSPEVCNKVSPEATAQYGDVLIACSAAGCLGRVAFYDQHDQVASTDTHVAIARANPEIVLPEYLYAYLRGAQGQFQLRSREKGDWTREKLGFRFTELNVSDMRRVPVPVPPIAEQRRIVEYLDSLQTKVDEMKRTRQEALRELDAMLPSILDRAFNGEL